MAELSVADAAKTVVLLHSTDASGNTSLGTAFLFGMAGRLFLITAEHVVRGMPAETNVTFGDAHDVPLTFPLTSIAGTPHLGWVHHGVADVAVLELRPRGDLAVLLQIRAIQTDHLISSLETPNRDRPLTIIGYPLGLGGLMVGPDARISPLSRESRPSSGMITLPRADTRQPAVMYLLDSPSIGGYSGAPVFLFPAAYSTGGSLALTSSDVFCLGLVHGTWGDNTGGKMAAIVPVAYIAETLTRAFGNAPTEHVGLTQSNYSFTVDTECSPPTP